MRNLKLLVIIGEIFSLLSAMIVTSMICLGLRESDVIDAIAICLYIIAGIILHDIQSNVKWEDCDKFDKDKEKEK